MKKRHLLALISLFVIFAMVLAGCSSEQGKDDDQRILRVRIVGDITNLDPAFIVGGVDDTVDRAVFEGLIRCTPNSIETENQLVEWIKTSEDGLEIHFKLREGVMWHKGFGELTTEDVKYSFERFQDPDLAAEIGRASCRERV